MNDPRSEVFVLKTKGYAVLILTKKWDDQKWYLFTVSTFTGSVSFDGIPGQSVFANANDAMNFIKQNHNVSGQEVIRGQALIGLQRYGHYLYILVVVESEPVARIQNRHTIYQVNKVMFIATEFPVHQRMPSKISRRITQIREFQLVKLHFWCWTRDLTNPTFAKGKPVKRSFVWNEFWTEPFAKLGLRDVCVDLLQGAVSSEVMTVGSEILKFTLVTVREAAFTGTRYQARGLDDEGHAANEVRIELIVETNTGKLWSHCVERGSVPVKWKSVCAKNLPTVSVVIDPMDAQKATPAYFEWLKEDFPGTIKCVNLMHSDPGQSEAPLCQAYAEAVASIEHVAYQEFDWHGNAKDAGIENAVGAYFKQLGVPCVARSVPDTMMPKGSPPDGPAKLFSNEASLGVTGVNFQTIQTDIHRFNCMDSLDRTNVGCFYYVCLVSSVILNELGLGNVITNYSDLMAMPSCLRKFLASSFIAIGNNISIIYTNTMACMTDHFYTVGGLPKDSRTQGNGQIAVLRRFHNFVTDKKRQKTIDLFLGKNIETLLPDVECGNLPTLVSDFPALVVSPILNMSKGIIDASALLQYQKCYLNCVPETSVLIELNQYSYVSHIVMVLSPPYPPTAVRIFTSLTHGPKIPLVSRVAVPQVRLPTPIVIEIPPDYANYVVPISRFILIEFETPHPELTLSNIFIYGSSKPRHHAYTETYQDFEGHQPPDGFQIAADTSPPESVMRGIRKVDYLAVMNLEVARLFHKMGRLECLSKLSKYQLDPLLFNIKYHKVRFGNEIAVNVNEKCCMCQADARWKCFACRNTYCDKCSNQTPVCETFYYTSPGMICQQCFSGYSTVVKSVDTVLALYNCFHKLCYPLEGDTNEWLVKSRRNCSPSSDPTKFPQAFFTNADDASFNMVLTDAGGSIKGPQNLLLSLGYPMAIHTITIESSDDCSLIVRKENSPEKHEIIASSAKSITCEITAQFLMVTLRKGTLNKFHLTGSAVSSPIKVEEVLSRRLPDPIEVKVKTSYISQKRLTVAELPKHMDVHGIIFREFGSVRSILLSFYAASPIKQPGSPTSVDYFYIPCAEPTFNLRFKHPASAKYVAIQYFDVLPGYSEPKITVY